MSDDLNKAERAYRDIRHAILTFELRGGQPIPERMLESGVGSSRTSIRTALGRLEAEGLVRRLGRRSIVTPIDPVEIEQAHDLLITIETAALKLIQPDRLDAGLAAMAAATMQAGDAPEDFAQATLDYHTALVGLAGNAFFDRASRDAQTRLARAAWLTRWLAVDKRQDWSRQRRIIAALRQGDVAAAVADLGSILRESQAAMSGLAREHRTGLMAHGVAVAASGETSTWRAG